MAEPLKNARHEAFVQALVTGLTITAAYKAAGYKGTTVLAATNGARLLKRPKVKARVKELKALSAEKAVKTRSELLNMLAENAEKAQANTQFSASNQAIKLYGQEMHGMFVERTLSLNKNVDEMTEDELRNLLGKWKA